MMTSFHATASDPTPPFSLPPWLLLLAFCGVALGGCFDYSIATTQCWIGDWHFRLWIGSWHFWFCCAVLGLLVGADRSGPLPRRLGLTLAGLLLTLLVIYLTHKIGDHHVKRRVAFGLLFGSGIPWLWTALLWLAAPIFLGPEHSRSSRLFRIAIGALLIYGLLTLASAVASIRPGISLYYFQSERVIYLPLLVAWLRAAQADPRLRTRTGRFVTWTLVALMLLAATVGVADLLGGPALRERLRLWNLVMAESNHADPRLPQRRLIFPMMHFNRTAYLGLVALMALFVAHFPAGPRRRIERFGLLAAGVACFVIIQTYTRGVIMSALVGLSLWACLVSRRALTGIVLISLAIALLLPAHRRAHLLSVFRVSTYELDPGSPKTSMQERLIAWDYAVELIRHNAWTGLGYSTIIIRDDYVNHIKKSGNARLIADIKGNHIMQHFHNLWLETAAESGIPAALALLVFCLARWTLLARNWRRSQGVERRRIAAWIAFECSLIVAGLIFYLLKRNFGLLTWGVWAYSLSEAEATASSPTTGRAAEIQTEACEIQTEA